MAIDRDDASASLREIANVERRTREALVYSGSSVMLMVWGVLVAGGYVYTHFNVTRAGPVWTGILVAGISSNFGVRQWKKRTRQHPWDNRIHYAFLALVAFGVFWTVLISPGRGRELAAFWPTLFMFGYVIGGFWLGRWFTWCGIVVTALTIAGYLWVGDWFYLYMAGVNGVGLFAGGLWLRRAG